MKYSYFPGCTLRTKARDLDAVSYTHLINHFALNCTDIQAAYAWICEQGYKVLSNGIEELPFWEKGVAFFIIEGPNKERIEFCERKQ